MDPMTRQWEAFGDDHAVTVLPSLIGTVLPQLVQNKPVILNCITLQCSICMCVLLHHAAAFVLPVFHHFWLRDGPILVSNDIASANHPCVHWVVAA